MGGHSIKGCAPPPFFFLGSPQAWQVLTTTTTEQLARVPRPGPDCCQRALTEIDIAERTASNLATKTVLVPHSKLESRRHRAKLRSAAFLRTRDHQRVFRVFPKMREGFVYVASPERKKEKTRAVVLVVRKHRSHVRRVTPPIACTALTALG